MRASQRKITVISVFLFMAMLISLQSIFVHQVSASPVAKINVHPMDQTVSSSFTVDINITDVTDLYSWEFRLNYSTSILTATGVTEGPFLQNGTDNVIWHGDDNENVYKTWASDPGTSVSSWSYTATSKGMLGIEYVNGMIYYVDYGDDLLYNFTVDGTFVASYSIVGFSANAYGLGWNGTHFLIADVGGTIYFAPFSNPTTSEHSITYTGAKAPKGVTFDGTDIWVSDVGGGPTPATIYKLNASTGAIKGSYDISSDCSNPVGITYDGTNLYVCDNDNTYKYSIGATLTLLDTFGTPGPSSEGLTFAAILPASPRNTWFYQKELDDAKGRVWYTGSLQGDVGGVDGSGVIATISFDVDANGDSDLDLHKTGLVGYNYTSKKTYRITHAPSDGEVTVVGVAFEFPLGAAAEIGIAAVIIYVWWRKRKPKLNTSLTSPR